MAQNTVEYWRDLANKFKKTLDATQEELDDYTNQSKELERELEAQLESAEKSNKSLTTAVQRLTSERDSLRTKLDLKQQDSCLEVKRLDEDLLKTTLERDELREYIRKLEQSNDDLERAERNAMVSLEDLEKRLNDAIERNAILESDLDNKESMVTEIQHLRDETRDLRQEMSVREARLKGVPDPITPQGHKPGSRLPKPAGTPSARVTPQQNYRNGITHSNTVDSCMSQSVPLTPSARISALNIVGDLLRKVGALESKLANSRKSASPNVNDDAPQAKQMLLNGRNHSKMKINS